MHSSGKVVQQFDYSREESEKEFMCAACNPSGQSFVLGSFDRYTVASIHATRHELLTRVEKFLFVL